MGGRIWLVFVVFVVFVVVVFVVLAVLVGVVGVVGCGSIIGRSNGSKHMVVFNFVFFRSIIRFQPSLCLG